jgi:hypothetical protein
VPPKTLSKYLFEELERRRSRRPAYSLRAFAMHLAISPASLSRILAGKQAVSDKLRPRLIKKLSLSQQQAAELSSGARRRSRAVKPKPFRLDTETFLKVNDLYHYAILNLLAVKGFRADPSWFSQVLDLPEPLCKTMWQRLITVGMVEQDESGRWERAYPDTTNIPERKVKLLAYRDIQIQILERAIRALHEVGGDRRDNSALTFSIDSRSLPEAMERIAAFRREFSSEFKTDNADQVYSFALALFPLTVPNAAETQGGS